MAEHSGIEWTDATFNAWWGCDEVSPACDHCYARTLAARFGLAWGADARRRFFGPKHWQEPLRWNERARKAGEQKRVFCASMADVFEILPPDHPDTENMAAARRDLFRLIEETPNLTWQLLTKRPKNIRRLAPSPWLMDGFPANVWVGCTVENQEWAEKRIPHLLRVPARVRFLSCEPLLGPVDLAQIPWAGEPGPNGETPVRQDVLKRTGYTTWHYGWPLNTGISWVIAGGESGHGARPTHPDWLRSLRDQCQAAGVPFHFKQWGNFAPFQRPEIPPHGCDYTWVSAVTGKQLPDVPQPRTEAIDAEWSWMGHVGKKQAGRVLDGRTWDEFPCPT